MTFFHATLLCVCENLPPLEWEEMKSYIYVPQEIIIVTKIMAWKISLFHLSYGRLNKTDLSLSQKNYFPCVTSMFRMTRRLFCQSIGGHNLFIIAFYTVQGIALNSVK